MIRLLWLIPIFFLFVIILTSTKKPNISFSWSRVGSFLGGIVILVVVCWVGYRGYRWLTKPPAPKNPTVTQTQVVQAPTIFVGQERKPYNFVDFQDEIIKVTIKSGEVDFYPQGGEIEITPPAPAKAWRDKPGIRQPRMKLPIGEYTITKVDASATGVEIWN